MSQKFNIGEIRGFSGGRLFDNDLVVKTVEIAKATATVPEYHSQIIVLLLGSNDWSQYQTTSSHFKARYISVIDLFLEIPGAGVLVANLPPRATGTNKRTNMSGANKIIKLMAQSYEKQVLYFFISIEAQEMLMRAPISFFYLQGRKVKMTDVKGAFLKTGNGDRNLGLNLADGTLKTDGVHMTEESVKVVCKKLINSLYYLPKTWL